VTCVVSVRCRQLWRKVEPPEEDSDSELEEEEDCGGAGLASGSQASHEIPKRSDSFRGSGSKEAIEQFRAVVADMVSSGECASVGLDMRCCRGVEYV